jgi:hypothetical protein
VLSVKIKIKTIKNLANFSNGRVGIFRSWMYGNTIRCLRKARSGAAWL